MINFSDNFNNLNNNSLQDNEEIIVHAILECCSVIDNFSSENKGTWANKKNIDITQKNIFKSFQERNYKPTVQKLYESVTGIKFDSKNSKTTNIPLFENFNNNKFAYFSAVYDLIDTFEKQKPTLIHSLNESIEDDNTNIISFVSDLDNCLLELEKIDDFLKIDTLPPEIKKIKIWAKKPIYVYGFDIINNLHLQKELLTKFGISKEQIFSIVFDKTNKQLLFIIPGNIIAYDIKTNGFDYYNKLHTNSLTVDIIPNIEKITPETYKYFLSEHVNNNIVELFFEINALNIKFTDNLYKDNARNNEINKIAEEKNKNRFIKAPQK